MIGRVRRESSTWWPPLDEIIAAARSFYPDSPAESQDPLSAAR
jgi:hypothetical protein